eukprot:g83286.t1
MAQQRSFTAELWNFPIDSDSTVVLLRVTVVKLTPPSIPLYSGGAIAQGVRSGQSAQVLQPIHSTLNRSTHSKPWPFDVLLMSLRRDREAKLNARRYNGRGWEMLCRSQTTLQVKTQNFQPPAKRLFGILAQRRCFAFCAGCRAVTHSAPRSQGLH